MPLCHSESAEKIHELFDSTTKNLINQFVPLLLMAGMMNYQVPCSEQNTAEPGGLRL
jgi:hypothetical protein